MPADCLQTSRLSHRLAAYDLQYSTSTFEAGLDASSLALDDTDSRKFLHVFCRNCKTETGLFDVLTAAVTLFKWQIGCQTILPTRGPTASECLVATLLATISRSGSSKSVITAHIHSPTAPTELQSSKNMPQVLHLWVLNPNVVYSSSSVPRRRVALKILFQRINSEDANKMIESMVSDVQEITFPKEAIESSLQQLEASSLLLPVRERCFKEWRVGLLERWQSNTGS